MKLFPAYFGARKRDDDVAPPEPEAESRDDVFRLIPPQASMRGENVEPFRPLALVEPPAPEPEPEPDPEPDPEIGRNVHPVQAMDLTRLSIDNDGRLYWDGKPVEVRRRLMMSPAQAIGALVIGLFVMIAGIGAAVQGLATAYEWGCRVGWVQSYCAPPAPPPPARPNIQT